MMIQPVLFLGFPIDELFASHLSAVNPKLLTLFIQDNENYLQKVVHQGHDYLGKYIGETVTYSDLTLFEKNIVSLLKKLVPDYCYPDSPLQLFSIDKLQ